MSFFRRSQSGGETEYRTQFWDQRLYALLFQSETENQRLNGHRVKCVLTERTTTIRQCLEPRHVYRGRLKIRLSETEYCTILVDIQFDKPDDKFDVPMNGVDVGYASISWASDSHQRPAILVQVKDTNGLSAQVADAYLAAKVSQQEGIDVEWAMTLTPMIGSSARDVWGEWPNDSPRDESGTLVPGKFPGLHALLLNSIEFTAKA